MTKDNDGGKIVKEARWKKKNYKGASLQFKADSPYETLCAWR